VKVTRGRRRRAPSVTSLAPVPTKSERRRHATWSRPIARLDWLSSLRRVGEAADRFRAGRAGPSPWVDPAASTTLTEARGDEEAARPPGQHRSSSSRSPERTIRAGAVRSPGTVALSDQSTMSQEDFLRTAMLGWCAGSTSAGSAGQRVLKLVVSARSTGEFAVLAVADRSMQQCPRTSPAAAVTNASFSRWVSLARGGTWPVCSVNVAYRTTPPRSAPASWPTTR
jgi:hypothetical protein